MAAQTSSFIPSIENPLLLMNEEDEGTISDELLENDQVEVLALNQEMVDHIESVEPNEPIKSPPVVENPLPTNISQTLH